MNFDPERLVRFALLRPRKAGEDAKRHGTFNRRMIAASLDSLLITVLIAPLVDYVFIQTYGVPEITVQQIAALSAKEQNSGEAVRVFLQEMQTSGFLDRWAINMRWQLYVLCIYTTICWHVWSATPGKMFCRLKIVDSKTGGRMGDWQSILRVLGYFLSAIPFGLGFFWIGLNKKRRGWHDLLAGTEVITQPRQREKTSILLKKRPLYKRTLYGSLVIFFWVGMLVVPKYLGIHLGAIEEGILTLVMLWLLSIATDWDMGFSKKLYDKDADKPEQECPPPDLPPAGGGTTSTPESARPSGSREPAAGE